MVEFDVDVIDAIRHHYYIGRRTTTSKQTSATYWARITNADRNCSVCSAIIERNASACFAYYGTEILIITIDIHIHAEVLNSSLSLIKQRIIKAVDGMALSVEDAVIRGYHRPSDIQLRKVGHVNIVFKVIVAGGVVANIV